MEKRIERLDKYLKYKHLSTNKVSVDAGLSTGVIAKSREPNRDLSDSACKKILNACLDLSDKWLFDGEGEMLKSENTVPITQTVNGVGNNNVKISTMDKALDEIAAQRKLTENALKVNAKSQEQIDRLLALLEKRG